MCRIWVDGNRTVQVSNLTTFSRERVLRSFNILEFFDLMNSSSKLLINVKSSDFNFAYGLQAAFAFAYPKSAKRHR